ncbi:MAG TPA: glycine dehydrogenase subunit 2 [Aigarchaeota archaeon]|nr:glycine dehydrogenase subunit 2 [Aigarchaeota archaeon]
MVFRQAAWEEPLVFELSREDAGGYSVAEPEKEILESAGDYLSRIPDGLVREELNLPQLTELEVVRHYTRLSQMNFSISTTFYPLGSCTMKYNPLLHNVLTSLDKVSNIHPMQPEETVQGCLEVLHRLERMLCEITGMSRFSFATAAGAHGEFVGCLIMRSYFRERGEERRKVIVPDSAHGTNPASASMAGFDVAVVKSDEEGCVDVRELERIVDEETAGIMLTNPNTLGVFERNIERIVEIIHDAGALLYYDGANLNAIAGLVRPGDMGFDIIHLNLHKTFSTPHGGGGPGAGPVGVVEKLERFLPPPLVVYDPGEGRYRLEWCRPGSVGPVKMFIGNFAVLLRAYAYLLALGGEGVRRASITAVAASNYLLKRMRGSRGVSLPFSPEKPRKHEFVLSLSKLRRETNVGALDVAKRLLDYGFHAPTVYFPQIVDEAFMVEPTETESKRMLDSFAEAFAKIIEEAYTSPEVVRAAPHSTAVGRVNEAKASHPKTITPSWRVYESRMGIKLEERMGDGRG